MENWLNEFLESLEVLLAERRVEEALATLDEAEKVVEDAHDRGTLNLGMLTGLQNAITTSRIKLADQLVETATKSSTKSAERRAVVLALKRLGDGPRAHSLLLNAHRQKLHQSMHSLKSAGTANAGVEYCTSLSKLVFSTIAQASNDSLVVFGEDSSYTSELVTWAVKETQQFGVLVRRQSLSQSAGSGNLRTAAACVQICLGHCSLLEARGLALSPVLLKDFKPIFDQALTSNLRRIEQSCAALASSDNWSLTLPPGGNATTQIKLTRSAHRFNSMVQVQLIINSYGKSN